MYAPIVCSLIAERIEAACVGTHTLHSVGGSVSVCAGLIYAVVLLQKMLDAQDGTRFSMASTSYIAITCMVKIDGNWTCCCSLTGLLAVLQGRCIGTARGEASTTAFAMVTACNVMACLCGEERRENTTQGAL